MYLNALVVIILYRNQKVGSVSQTFSNSKI